MPSIPPARPGSVRCVQCVSGLSCGHCYRNRTRPHLVHQQWDKKKSCQKSSARANTVQNGLTPPMTNRKPGASADFRFRCCFGYLAAPPQCVFAGLLFPCPFLGSMFPSLFLSVVAATPLYPVRSRFGEAEPEVGPAAGCFLCVSAHPASRLLDRSMPSGVLCKARMSSHCMGEKPGLGGEWVRLCKACCTILDFCSALSPEEGKWGTSVTP